ncbi:MAG: DUF2089 domain-containing protein [Spirochaetaceae bacterium]|nr:MAG: DUF2089 domain-containing protein [Spirochaetaceae bacterium]
MEKRMLKECPVCGDSLRVRVFQCASCQTRVEGVFEPPQSRLLSLSRKDLEFAELFIRVRGNIKEVEKVLSVSYPTVRSMLDGVIERMGYTVRNEQLSTKRRMEIIEQLEKGVITAEKAAELLKSGGDEDENSADSK